jgi:3-deoxy-D-manno-octulosonic-acid transferase
VENFKDIAGSTLKLNAGIMVHTADELTEKMAMLLRNDDLCRKMGSNAQLVIKEQQQAMKKTVDLVVTALKIDK